MISFKHPMSMWTSFSTSILSFFIHFYGSNHVGYDGSVDL